MQQAEKYKNERHHTYATFLFRNVRQVSQLTGKSNVTKKVHESGMTSCTAQKRATGLRNHTSVKQQTRSKSSRHGMYRTTVTKSRYTVANSPHTSMIPITQGGSAFNVFDLDCDKETCCAVFFHFSMRTTSRAASTNFTFGRVHSDSALVTTVMHAYNRHTFTNFIG